MAKTEFGVRWTPSAATQTRVAHTGDGARAARLARQLRGGQRLLGHKVDAVVVYRTPGGEWIAVRPLRWCGPLKADALAQQLLDDLQAHPGGPMRVLADRYPDHT